MASDANQPSAWLESEGEQFPIQGNCTVGRALKNCIVLDSQKVSRRHAVINVQNIGEFWLIDLGSSNGTFLNHRRLHQPVRLADQDEIIIGDRAFVFRQPEEISEAYRTTLAERTIREIENVPCWLLVADIENFTPLSRSLTSEKLAALIGGWVGACKEIIEANDGMIDKYLGDGFFAYWRDERDLTQKVAAALKQLKELQARHEPRFRLALHYGSVAIGGVPSMGEESLMGKEVNFAFRMEKLAGALGIFLLTSAAGQAKLASLLPCDSAGAHAVKGFEGEFQFYRC